MGFSRKEYWSGVSLPSSDPLHKNPKESTRKLLELINAYSKFEGYKINTQESLAFLYTSNEKIENKLRKQSHSPFQ